METIKDLVTNGRATRGVEVQVSTPNLVKGEVSHHDKEGNVFILVGPLPPEELTVLPPEREFTIHLTWSMIGEFKVTARSLEEAIDKVESSEPPYDGCPQGEYVDDSMEVNKQMCEETN